MFINILKTTIRYLLKNKQYLFINILGLSTGLGAFILMMLFVRYEKSFDSYNENYKNIYRVEQKLFKPTWSEFNSIAPMPLGPILESKYPEIKQTVRIVGSNVYLAKEKNNSVLEKRCFYTEKSFFNIFTVEFIHGDKNALSQPLSVVLTEKIAKKYFQDENPMNKTILLNNKYNLNVTGVIKDLPANNHFNLELLISLNSREFMSEINILNNWEYGAYTYVLAEDNISMDTFKDKIKNLLDEYINNNKDELYLKPLKDIHFSMTGNELSQGIPKSIIFLYIGVALFTLILACLNFINITIAHATGRVKEIGIRKAIGSLKRQIIFQFLAEAIIISILSLAVSCILVEFFLPVLNAVVDRELNIRYFHDTFFLFIFCIALLIGIISGFYPAFRLSFFDSGSILKQRIDNKNFKSSPIKALVLFQFIITAVFIIVTISVQNQIKFLQSKELGFDQQNILIQKIPDNENKNFSKLNSLKQELSALPGIQNVSISQTVPFSWSDSKKINWEGAEPEEEINMNYNYVDFDFLTTYGVKIIEGRNFSIDHTSDLNNACIVNETAVKIMGWKDPIGKTIENGKFRVIGVMQNFHIWSVFVSIPPYVLYLNPDSVNTANFFSIKLLQSNNKQIINDLTKYFMSVYPDDYNGVDWIENKIYDWDKNSYDLVKRIFNTLSFFTLVAVIIAIVGLYGFISYTLNRKTKEIGIRKILGGTSYSIFFFFIRKYLNLQIISLAASWGISYLIIDQLLKVLPYNSPISFEIFLLTAAIIVVITLITISFRIYRASISNPVEALRYE
ncbi:MAG: ABC transporter permease [Bacteroidales bacterium]|nr:ABC transporter permease [Bacteroidales bacterium]